MTAIVGSVAKILLVEDDAEDAEIIRRLLGVARWHSYQVTWCATADAARVQLASGDYDAVLLDYRLGGETGLDLLRSIDAARLPPIILLTGVVAATALEQEALTAGVADFLEKSRLDAQTLDRTIRYAIGRQRAELERRLLEEQFRQAQKMEVVGQLAGGVAHDFNNLLTVIIGAAEILASALPPQSPLLGEVEEIQSAASRATDVTRRLLGFSRRQMVRPRDVALREVVEGIQPMLARLLGEDVSARIEFAADDTLLARVDQGEMEQVVLNLVLNARDAMHGGGEVVITGDDAPPIADLVVSTPGGGELDWEGISWVHLAVRDTGDGMSAEMRARIFEPFFTTKPVGRGTGLGLALVYGVAQRAGGCVGVESAPGEGTTLHVWLPQATPRTTGRRTPIAQTAPVPRPPSERIRACVLVVEDEASVRGLAIRVLRQAGYTVVEAGSASEALRMLPSMWESIDVVVSDVVMPGMDGLAFAARLSKEHPSVAVILTTGYTDEELARRVEIDDRIPFIRKPYTHKELLETVHAALTRREMSPA